MTSLFISYSRKDIEYARQLTEALQGQDLDFWIDWEGIPPTVDWWKEIQKGIEEANIFVFLISPDSVQSKICRQEIEHAIKNGKRLIPVVVRDIKANEVPAELSPLNWIFLRPADDFGTSFEKLITAIKTDYAWVQTHRQLQVKALEWERNNYESSFLLRGKEFQEAESQLVENGSKEPNPTDLQRDYLRKSKQAADTFRRIVVGITAAGIVTLAALAVFGFVQANRATANANTAQNNAATAQAASLLANHNAATAQANAEIADRRAKIARAGELVALEMSQTNTPFNLSLLLGVEALKTYKDSRTQLALLNLMNTNPALSTYLTGHTDEVKAIAFRGDGQVLASASLDDTVTLWDMSQPGRPGLLSTLPGGTGVAFVPDGKILVSGNLDSTVTLWDVSDPRTPNQIIALQNSGDVASAALSPDGKTVASGGYSDTIILWDVSHPAAPVKQCTLSEPDIRTEPLVFNPNGTILVSGGLDHTSILWDISKPGCPVRLSTLSGQSQDVTSIVFSNNGSTLASASFDNTIVLWDVSNPAQPIKVSVVQGNGQRVDDAILGLALSPDGATLASANNNRTVSLWNVSDPAAVTPIDTLTGHGNSVSSVAFSPDGKRLVSGDLSGSMILWNVANAFSAFRFSTLSKPFANVLDLDFDPKKKIVATRGCETFDTNTGCADRIVFWDLTDPVNPRKVSSIPQQSDKNLYSNDIAFDSSGTMLAVADCLSVDTDTNGHCLMSKTSLWNVSDPLHPHAISALPPQISDISNLAFSPDAGTLALGSCKQRDTNHFCVEGEITLWDIKDRSHPVLLSSVSRQTSNFSALAFRPDGKSLASASCWIEVQNGTAGCTGGEITLWDIHDPKAPQSFSTTPDPRDVYDLAFSPNGQFMVSGGDDGSITFWNVTQPAAPVKLSTLSEHTGPVYSIAVSPDSKYLASGSCANFGDANFCTQGEMNLWDISDPSNPAKLATLLDHTDLVNAVAFDSDSTVLASASDDGSISFWDIDPESWIEKSCQRAGRGFSVQEWIKFFPGESYRFTCPDIPISIKDAIDIADYSVLIHDSSFARVAFERVVEEYKNSQDAANLNDLCWFGSIDGFSELVLPTCDRAVDLATRKNETENMNRYRDSRGLARALTGDTPGAIEDFSAYVAGSQNNTSLDQDREKRVAWIHALQAGQNPFTPDVLAELRGE